MSPPEPPPASPVAVVQRQLEAYNDRDLARFVACYAADVEVYQLPQREPVMTGRAALSEHYRTKRFNLPALHADVVHRSVIGHRVFDHERIHGVRPVPYDAAAIYEVDGETIRRVWFFAQD